MFEFLFKYPPTVFRKGEFVFASGWPSWLLAGMIIAAAGGLAWHLRRNPGRLGGRRLMAIGALQVAAVALVLFLFWQPAISIQSLRAQQNVVSILVDTSRSMALADEGQPRLEKVRGVLESGLVKQLQEKFQVRLYSFAGQLQRLSSLDAVKVPGNSTRVGEAVGTLLGESTVIPLGAVVVFSDGSDTTGKFDRRLMAEIRQRNVPVHTVGVGRARIPEDIELHDVTVASRVLPNSRSSAQAVIRHSGDRERTTRLSVRDGSRVLASKTITLRRGETLQSEWIDFGTGQPGIRSLRFLLDPVEGEQILGNNSLSRVVDVPRGRRSILYVEGEPRWEYKFIRRAVEKDESVRLVTMLRTTPNKFYRQGVDDESELAGGFPSKAEDLFAYDALVIGSIEAAFFTPAQQELILQFVNRRGGALLMLGGRRGLADGGWGLSRVSEVLPAKLAEESAQSFYRERARVELTVQGQDSLICRFDEEPEKNRKLWEELPELADYQRVGELKPAALTLVNAQAANETFPLLVGQNYGRGKALLMATGGTWRWRMQLPHDDTRFYTFWQQLLRSLVAGAPGPVVISSDRTLYADETRVQLRAEARTKEYEPASNATVTAVVTPEVGDPFTVELHPSADEPSVYEAELIAAQPGAYRAEVRAHVGELALGSDVFHFRREDGVAEDFHPEQNRELLTRLAEQTGGRYWTLDDVAGLPSEIRFSEAGITARETMDLWDMPALFLLLLALRGAEWLLRRRWGVV